MAAADNADAAGSPPKGNEMKRRVIVVGGIAVVVAVAIWLLLVRVGHGGRSDYSGTVETREIQIGSKVGGRVTEVPVEEGMVVLDAVHRIQVLAGASR